MTPESPAERGHRAVRQHGPEGASETLREVSARAEAASNHPWFRRAARLGHVANGLLHLVIGFIAWNLAFGSAPGDADQSGAIQLMAAQPLGLLLVLLCALGCALLGLWHLSEAAWDRQSAPAGLKDLSKAVVYVVIGGTFLMTAFGVEQDSGESSASFSAALMAHPLGAVLLVVVGATVIGVGGYHVFKGVTQRFMEDLRSTGRREVSLAIQVVGTMGYAAKGIVLGLVGLLFVAATIQQDPEEATGLDGALRALLDQPAGPVLLAGVGVGLVLFGAYSLMRSRYEE